MKLFRDIPIKSQSRDRFNPEFENRNGSKFQYGSNLQWACDEWIKSNFGIHQKKWAWKVFLKFSKFFNFRIFISSSHCVANFSTKKSYFQFDNQIITSLGTFKPRKNGRISSSSDYLRVRTRVKNYRIFLKIMFHQY